MKRSICIIGVPMDLGQSRRGVDLGPGAVRYAGIARRLRALSWEVRDCGNVEIPVRDELPPEGGLKFLPSIVRACEAIYEAGRRAIDDGDIPLFLGGDHSIALGTVAATTLQPSTGVLWVDAHGDFNTPETSPSGNIHGMPLAALTGIGNSEMVDLGRPGAKLPAENVVLIAIRDLDPEERELLRDSGAKIFTMREIDERGIGPITDEALEYLARCDRLHVSLDMDSVDPRHAPGVGTPVAGGLTYREAHLLMEKIADSPTVIGSMDVVEINPILDTRNQTAELAVDLVTSALGAKIL